MESIKRRKKFPNRKWISSHRLQVAVSVCKKMNSFPFEFVSRSGAAPYRRLACEWDSYRNSKPLVEFNSKDAKSSRMRSAPAHSSCMKSTQFANVIASVSVIQTEMSEHGQKKPFSHVVAAQYYGSQQSQNVITQHVWCERPEVFACTKRLFITIKCT